MKLQTKFLLALLPTVIGSLLLLGVWAAQNAVEGVHQTADNYLDTALNSFVSQDLDKRYQILKKNNLDRVPSFTSLYQKEAGQSASKISLIWPGHIFVFDHGGKLVFDTRGQKASAIEAQWGPVIKDLLASDRSTISGNLGPEIYRATRFEPWSWLVFVSFDDRPLHEASQRIKTATLIITLGSALLITLILALLFKFFVVRNISILRQAASDIAARQSPESVGVTTSDELGALARDIEKMSGDLNQSQREILRFTNDLESMVDKRTQELEKSQSRLAKAQEIAQMGNFDWDIKTDALHLSDQAFRIFGLEPQEQEPSSKDFMNFVHPQDSTRLRKAVAQALSKHKPYHLEHRIIRADGVVRMVTAIGEISYGPDGRAVNLVGTVHDVTERRTAEKKMLHQEKLQSAIETAGAVCHELNQPLQAILSHLELLALENRSAGLDSRLKIIEQGVERMAEITAKLQRITKYETREYVDDTKILDLEKATE